MGAQLAGAPMGVNFFYEMRNLKVTFLLESKKKI